MDDEFDPVSPPVRNSIAAVFHSLVSIKDTLVKIRGNRSPLIGRGKVITVDPKAGDPFPEQRGGLDGGAEIIVISKAGKEEIKKSFVVIVPDEPGPVSHPNDNKNGEE
jgi:hypothetical protein